MHPRTLLLPLLPSRGNLITLETVQGAQMGALENMKPTVELAFWAIYSGLEREGAPRKRTGLRYPEKNSEVFKTPFFLLFFYLHRSLLSTTLLSPGTGSKLPLPPWDPMVWWDRSYPSLSHLEFHHGRKMGYKWETIWKPSWRLSWRFIVGKVGYKCSK